MEYLTDDVVAAGLCPRTSGRADDQDLLRRRMIALDLDPYELALSDPALLRHLERCCALCENREGCVADLALPAATCRVRQDWRDYCENVAALEMLMALQIRSSTTPKQQLPMSAEVGEILVPRSIPGACFDDLRQIKAGAIDFSDDSENEEQVT